jgi:hypothetical protein
MPYILLHISLGMFTETSDVKTCGPRQAYLLHLQVVRCYGGGKSAT